MKRILFWKIYLGFGVTFVFVVDGLWLLFNVLHPLPSETTRALARISLASANVMIERGGMHELHAMLEKWPLDERGQMVVRPWKAGTVLQTNIDSGALSIRSQDPSGKSYEVMYEVRRHLGYGRGPFDIPPEITMLAMLGGLIFSAILAWHLTNPIRQISSGLRQLANADFSARLSPTMRWRRDEFAELTAEFDRLAERLQELVAAREKLISDVSHELRTPLTRLQLAVGLAHQSPAQIEESLTRIGREVNHIDDLVGELLTLSRLEGDGPHPGDCFDLTEVLHSLVEDAQIEAATRDAEVVLRFVPPGDARERIVAGSGRLVHRAVENILRNAIRFSHRGQKVEVTLDSGQEGRFFLVVTDRGPGVSEEFLPSFFEPFAQRCAEDDHSGVGLGLSIAKRAIVATNGAISVANRAGGGLMISIILPAAPNQALDTRPA